MFKKKDLKDGDVVTYRNGWKRTFIEGKLINEEGTISKTIDEYNENLENLSFGGPSKENDLNIVKVERPIKYQTVYEYKPEILDEAEKRYLKGVIRPFRSKVLQIAKKYDCFTELEYIKITIKDDASLEFPSFSKNTMYKNMEIDKKYTLEELEL